MRYACFTSDILTSLQKYLCTVEIGGAELKARNRNSIASVELCGAKPVSRWCMIQNWCTGAW